MNPVETSIQALSRPVPRGRGQLGARKGLPTALTLAADGTALLIDHLDCSPAPTFVINADHAITHWNPACERLFGRKAAEMLGTGTHREITGHEAQAILADLVVEGRSEELSGASFQGKYRKSTAFPGAVETEACLPDQSGALRWLCFAAAPLCDIHGRIVGAVEVIRDITQEKDAEVALLARDAELSCLRTELAEAREQLLQSEKLASIGQLAAGVAHEINNPIGYVFSNFNSLQGYIEDLFAMLAAFEKAVVHLTDPQARAALAAAREQVDLAFLKDDIPVLLRESGEGISRVRKIVEDLKDFSRRQSGQGWQLADLHQGIESTLNIVSNEVKYKADIMRDFGEIPPIACIPSEINQVVMNLVVNASHAIGEGRGTITIRTRAADGHVMLEIEDNGCGMTREIQARLFTPFFTTKPVGQGTGLGLSLSYGIVQRHHGSIEVESEPGVGTCFRIRLPVAHAASEAEGPAT